MGKTSITIKTLSLRYFKGLRQFDITFSPKENFVLGANGAGKTTIHDGYSWLLFGKNAQGDSDSKFNIKTLDKDNNVIHRVEHVVQAVLMVGDEEVTLKRVFKEKWVKPRGAIDAEFSGHTTDFYWNNVPKNQKEYQEKINGIIDESVFKLLSDPLAFNNQHWEAQRNLLITIAGEVKDMDIAQGNKAFTELLAKLSNKTLKEYKAELAAERKKLNDAIKDIPARIDEVSQGKPEAKDYEALKSELAGLEKKLADVQSKIDDVDRANQSINDEKSEIRNKIFELTTSSGNIKIQVQQEIRGKQEDPFKLQRELKEKVDAQQRVHDKLNREAKDIETDIAGNKTKMDELEADMAQLRKEFQAEDKKQLIFGDDFKCPACQRPLEASDIEQKKKDMQSDFNEDKAKSLEIINKRGMQLKEQKLAKENYAKELENQLNTVNGHIKDSEAQLKELQKQYDAEVQKPKETVDVESQIENALDFNKDYQSQLKQIKELNEKLDNFKPKSAQELIDERAQLQQRINDIKYDLREEEMIANADKRIAELEASESDFAQQIADIEKMEYVAQEFTIAKVSALEEKVNKLFTDGIRWKLFSEQINGGQVPTCICTYLGVDWLDLNSASKVKVGTKIIEVLSSFYGISVPVWYDNAESTTDIPKIDAQQIKLYVNDSYKTLTVK